jgi:hypothetical protein
MPQTRSGTNSRTAVFLYSCIPACHAANKGFLVGGNLLLILEGFGKSSSSADSGDALFDFPFSLKCSSIFPDSRLISSVTDDQSDTAGHRRIRDLPLAQHQPSIRRPRPDGPQCLPIDSLLQLLAGVRRPNSTFSPFAPVSMAEKPDRPVASDEQCLSQTVARLPRGNDSRPRENGAGEF